MNKIFIIIGREFTTRVKKKSFLITTIAVPLLFVAFYAFLMWMMLKKDTQERQIAVINASSIKTPLEKINNTNFIYTDENITQEESADYLQKNGYYAILWIPANVMEEADITINSFSQIPPELESNIHTQLQNKIENIKKAAVITETNLPDLGKKLNATKTPVKIRTLKQSDTGEAKESSSAIASIIGLIAGMAIYMFIFLYASVVMRGVIEEKTNRIIEVLVSSVKPFQFLMGKIIGVASVGLVQFLIWIFIGLISVMALLSAFMPNIDMESLRNTTDLVAMAQTNNLDVEQLEMVKNIAQTIAPSYIISFFAAFIFFFLAGYLLYASIFAAIGAAVDNETDSQQFMTPLTIVLVAALYIGIAAMRNPETSIVYWASFVPFTSPVVMLVRMAFGVPTWELLVSAALLIAAFIFFTWLSAKIYRVGILMYGKKPSWKELYKWLKY